MTKSYYFLSCFFVFTIFFIAQFSFAQKRCNIVEAEKLRRQKYKFLPSEADFENWMRSKIQERRNKPVPFGTHEEGEPDKIAVVVHVIHNDEPYGEGTNITDEQIHSQIEVLNEDYQRKNGDTTQTQAEFRSVASKLNIEFVLARQTKEGNPTTGIVRKRGTKDAYSINVPDRELLSGISQWDPNIYLNIWVTNLQSPYIGLAQFPDFDYPGLEDEQNTDNESTDGMVIDYRAFGSAAKVPGLDLMPNYNLGRTSTHEIGHFFGLKHVWGDITGPSGCNVDDYVIDTPNSSNEYSGVCTPSDHVSCSSNDMYENFLYYTNDACMNIFTAGQVERMQVIIENAPRRTSLINSIGTEYPNDMYFDLAVHSVLSPGKVSCSNEINSVIEIKNNGTVPVTDFDITYNVNGQTTTIPYEGDTISSGEIIELIRILSTLQDGSQILTVSLSNIPGDINGANNQLKHAFAVDHQTDFIPLREQFEVSDLSLTNWITVNEDGAIGWELADAPKTLDENVAAFMNFYNYEDLQQMDWLISPALDFSNAVAASLTFKASYAKNQNHNDQLRIMGSKDCGTNFDDVLVIYNSNDLSVQSSDKFWEPVNQSDWKEQSLDLSEYAGEQNIRIAFLTINGYGNNLYLDDVEFYTTSEDKIVKAGLNSFTIFPNPSGDGRFQLAMNTSERQQVVIFIYDHMGRLITQDEYPNTLNQTYHYNLAGFRSGVYYIHVKGKDFVRSQKLLITR